MHLRKTEEAEVPGLEVAPWEEERVDIPKLRCPVETDAEPAARTVPVGMRMILVNCARDMHCAVDALPDCKSTEVPALVEHVTMGRKDVDLLAVA